MHWNLPMALTLGRVLAIPAVLALFYLPIPYARQWACVLYSAACLTDWLDGYLARKRREVTTLGTLLDPIADKLLTSSAFIALVELRLAPAWIIVVIVGREFVVSGIRSIAASRGMIIAASRWGKYKTAAQVVAITLLILTNTLERWLAYGNLGRAALWVVMALAIISMLHYLRGFLRTVDLRSDTA